ncbi:hypothetical protein BUALT_Bualt12G0063000 [Buddleja alternifolia]|uniref:3'-5' exonuclease domain-containing protein n=1 Tax=Buddleja alternifolia TaxID=168488 RepID=A0AAV6WXK9_9LAMI|nr:hypothetical protein BUALT_Bualt12G0063000 [Buddleja alternifolia]
MAYNPVSIESHHSPNPSKQEYYTVICHSHRVRTTVTATPSVVRKWVNRIRYHHRYHIRSGRLVVGLGVQWTPSTDPPPATLQLCVGHDCLIFQLEHTNTTPAALHRFLAEPGVTFVGIWNYRDEGLLRCSRHRLRVSRLVDVRDVACEMRGCRRGAPMEELAGEVLGMGGVVKDGVVGRSEWDDEWLSEEQVEYACVDVFIAFLMGKALRAWKWIDYSSDDGDDDSGDQSID